MLIDRPGNSTCIIEFEGRGGGQGDGAPDRGLKCAHVEIEHGRLMYAEGRSGLQTDDGTYRT